MVPASPTVPPYGACLTYSAVQCLTHLQCRLTRGVIIDHQEQDKCGIARHSLIQEVTAHTGGERTGVMFSYEDSCGIARHALIQEVTVHTGGELIGVMFSYERRA